MFERQMEVKDIWKETVGGFPVTSNWFLLWASDYYRACAAISRDEKTEKKVYQHSENPNIQGFCLIILIPKRFYPSRLIQVLLASYNFFQTLSSKYRQLWTPWMLSSVYIFFCSPFRGKISHMQKLQENTGHLHKHIEEFRLSNPIKRPAMHLFYTQIFCVSTYLISLHYDKNTL